MKTIWSIFLLLVYGGVAGFLMVFVLNLAGLPGALLGGMPGKRSKQRFIFGSIVSALGQSYVNLAFVSFIVSWTHLAARRDDVVGFLVWPVAFLAVQVPTLTNLARARIEAREQEHASVQVEALHLTYLATLLAFPLFAFLPILMNGWAWVPMVSSMIGAE
ncbi:hypothetical protein LCGC14_2347680 [marine sediment metagenome]|uniref:Uncharacterized protein n=1 Tax=marine sediment metagenome TaxID=412755 RepID=A0A0F9CXI3_9ZZZZ